MKASPAEGMRMTNDFWRRWLVGIVVGALAGLVVGLLVRWLTSVGDPWDNPFIYVGVGLFVGAMWSGFSHTQTRADHGTGGLPGNPARRGQARRRGR